MDELIPLKLSTLHRMPSSVRVPSYERQHLSAGIVHIGLGNFHRAHQAWYLHRLFEAGICKDWAIIGAGVRAPDALQRQRLEAQDWLTTLVELDPSGKSAEIISSIIDYLPVEPDNASLIERMSRLDIRIVSLTVTEGGYYIDTADDGFDAAHPDIRHDVENPQRPKTAFGAMVEALRLRRERGLGPFTCLSCDNLQGNGAILRRTIVSLASLMDDDLARWIDTKCSFPNSMVDCIVPATGTDELALVQSMGIDDASPVTHENFRQWVIEDDFCAGRPDWDRVGVTFTRDVHAFETMKLRILNGGHQLIAIPAQLLSIDTICAAMAHPLIGGYLERVVRAEIAPHVASVPGTNALDYLALVTRRFSNAEIRDTTRRVAFDGSSRQPGFLFPSIRDGLDSGAPITGLALSTALWCKYCEGVREDGSWIEPNDPNWAELHRAAQEAKADPQRWLEQTRYFGALGPMPQYARAFVEWHNQLSADGVEAAIGSYLERSSSAVSQPGSRKLA